MAKKKDIIEPFRNFCSRANGKISEKKGSTSIKGGRYQVVTCKFSSPKEFQIEHNFNLNGKGGSISFAGKPRKVKGERWVRRVINDKDMDGHMLTGEGKISRSFSSTNRAHKGLTQTPGQIYGKWRKVELRRYTGHPKGVQYHIEAK